MLAISAKLVVIFPHASVNISLMTSPHTSSNTYKGQNVVVNLVLRIVSKSLMGLAREITLVLVLQHSIENRSNITSVIIKDEGLRLIISFLTFEDNRTCLNEKAV